MKISVGVLIGVILVELLDYPAANLIFAAVVLFVLSLIFSIATRSRSEKNKSSSERAKGTVERFNNSKGFGFIIQEGRGDVFVHHNLITGSGRKTLLEGQQVTMKVIQKEKGPQAENVICL